MKVSDLISHYPRLWHMAEDGSWDSIRERGLLSTSALLDLYDVNAELRHALEFKRRPNPVTIEHSSLPPTVIRDQKPIQEKKLRNCLEGGLTPEDWYRMLNSRVFFWASFDRLRGLFDAYQGRPHTILTVDTKSLVTAYLNKIQLSPINSGSTYYNAVQRGPNTFLPIGDYPFEELRKKKKGPARAIAELVVLGGVPDIADHVVEVCRIDAGVKEQIWQREAVCDDDGFFEFA